MASPQLQPQQGGYYYQDPQKTAAAAYYPTDGVPMVTPAAVDTNAAYNPYNTVALVSIPAPTFEGAIPYTPSEEPEQQERDAVGPNMLVFNPETIEKRDIGVDHSHDVGGFDMNV
jgi:hypothetical protein